ncbi:hypothetical protein ACTWJ8_40360 (plasmid) [Streptomyces sp. SDT5-1]|uniref:hypothetical protein n=1 Tax=Streptomyces sp. SDT5-1 TaxID=3406418 RepID=UPI003FD5CB57
MGKPEGKDVRIPWVYDANGDQYDRAAIDVKPAPRYVPPLTCGGCRIPVHARPGHADSPDSRASHYAKNPGQQHKSSCRFDLDQRGKEIAGQAPPGTVVRRGGQWRLICPPLGGPGSRPGGPLPPGPPSGARPTASGPRKTSDLKGPAIASARRIVRLLENFRNDPRASEQFAAVAPGGRRDIPWTEFCRGRADVHELAQALIDGTAAPIPHAVWGPVSTASAVDGTAGRTYVVKYVAREPVLIGDRRVPLQVTLRSTNADWIGAASRSGKFLGYGHWTLFPKPDHVRRGIEIQLWVNEPWQVARWGTDGTRQTFPSPPPAAPPAPKPAPSTRSLPAPPPHATPAKKAPPANSATVPASADQHEPAAPPPAPPTPPATSENAAIPDAPAAALPVVPPRELPTDRLSDPVAADEPNDPAPQDAAPEPGPLQDAPAQPSVPPMPGVPPQPTTPPPPPPSTPGPESRPRRRLKGWLDRRRKHR